MRNYDRPPPPRRDDRDDWRGGGGGGGSNGGPRGRGAGGGGRRGPSPPREPTPPGTIPLEERVLPYTMWDVRPPQFDGISGMEAKMTGMFTYGPGRVPPPAHLLQPMPANASPFSPDFIGFITPARRAKRVYIPNVTEETDKGDLRRTIEMFMHEKNLAADRPGDVVELVHVNKEKFYAVVEFRSAAEAKAALQLDGTEYQDSELKVKAPEEFIGIDPTLGSGEASNNPDKLFIGGLPTHLNEEQVSELLKSFGELSKFNLVKELQDGVMVSKGFAFCEFTDPSVTDLAIQGLNNFQLGDRMLVVQRADTSKPTAAPTGAAIPGTTNFLNSIQAMLAEAKVQPEEVTSRCMVMLNMVEPDELRDDEEYQDILADINDECSKFGPVEGVRVPRPVPKASTWEPSDTAATRAEKNRQVDEANGVGKVYVMFHNVADVQKAMLALGGRQFAGRTILVASISESEFMGPAPPPPPALPAPPPSEPSNGGAPPPAPEPARAPPPPRDIEAEADDLLKDIMG